MKQFYLTQKINSIVSVVLILLGLKEENVGTTSVTTTSAINFNTRNAFGMYSFKAALVFLLLALTFGQSVNATTCPSATVIAPGTLPISNQAIVCGTVNDITSLTVAPSALLGGCSNSNYYGGLESLYSFTPTATGLYSLSISGQTWTQISVFNGCPTTAGTTCVGGVASSANTKSLDVTLTAGVTYFILFDTWPSPNSPCPGTFSLSQIPPNTRTASVFGGLWSSPATWGGTVPNAASTVVIPAGAIVTVDQVVSVANITVDGTLQWNATANAMTVNGDLTISNTGRFLPYSSVATPVGVALTVAGNFTNNGFANLAVASTGLTFNGSGSTLSGTGTFQGDGTRGFIRSLNFINTGSNSITTSQNLVAVFGLAHTAGSLNTNGKLTLDNTVQVYGQAFNTSVASIAVTAMGSAYSVAPVVFGTAVTQWTSGGASTATARYVSGGNVYLGNSTAGLGTVAPTHTSGLGGTNNNLLWVGTVGTLGNPYPLNAASTVGTQYFYGDNLYVATVANAAAANNAAGVPVHTSGIVGGYLYVGTAAKATVNYDATTLTVRSLNITNAGSGYSSAPSVAFSVGVAAGAGSGAAATAVVFQQIAGAASHTMQKSGGAATISGGLTINSDQGASSSGFEQSSSGVGAVSTAGGGVNYTAAPAVGFTLPTALNLVTNPGTVGEYAAAPTITVSGGTLVSGTGITSASFTITVNNGVVESVYLSTPGTSTYSVLPTLAFSSGTATLAFPTGCLAEADAFIGSNGQITDFTIKKAGFGYVAAPTVGLGGGTFTTAATTPAARIGLYNLTTNFFAPATAAVVNPDDAAIPSNRKINTLTLAGNGLGQNLSSDLILYGTTPLALNASGNGTGNILDMGGNTITCTWNGFGGLTSTFGATNTYIRNGSFALTGRGGASNFNYPFSGTFTWSASAGTLLTGSSVTKVTVSDTAAPTNATLGSGSAIGNRAFRVRYSSGNPGLTPAVTLGFNSQDALTVTQNLLFVADAAALNGPWTVRSTAFGASGALPATGTKATATVSPGPIAATGDNYYAWSILNPTITDVNPLLVCANSGTFTITGTNLLGTTAVSIGGTPVTSFTVVNDTTITGVAGNGTDGFVSIVKAGVTTTGVQTVTVSSSPLAPSVSPATASIVLGGSPNVTASGSESIFNWYAAATGGSPVLVGATYTLPVCSSTTLYVAQSNGSCEGPRTAVPVTVQATAITASTPTFCGTGGTSTLSATPVDSSISYTWTSISGASLSTTSGNSTVATVVTSSDFQVTGTSTLGGCTATATISVSVYPLPNATVTTSVSGVCPGTSATINSGLSAGNFTSASITHAPRIAPGSATVLAASGAAVVPLTGGTLDDGGWGAVPIGFNFNFFGTSYSTINVGTNGTLQFGAFNNNGGFTTPFGLSDFSFTTLPSTGEPFNMVAVLANDNHLTTSTINGGTLRYWTEGIAPNRKFVVEYNQVRQWNSTTNTSTSQAVFFETTGVVEVHVTGSTSTNSKLVGINNGNGTIGVLALNTAAAITTPVAYRFSPPSNYNITWSSVGPGNVLTTIGTPNALNNFSITVTPSVTTTYDLRYTNTTTGCTNIVDSDRVTLTILDNVAPATVAVSNVATVCVGGSANLSLTGNVNSAGNTDGLTYQWQVSTDAGATWNTIDAATNATTTVTPTVASSYQCLVSVCGGTAVASSPVSVGFTNTVDSTTPATRCGTGAVQLFATTSSPGATLNWYTVPTGGTAVGTGSPLNIANLLLGTTTYYVAAETTGPACSSARVAVTATATTPATPLTLSSGTASLCVGSSSSAVTLTSGLGFYDTYVWSPSTGVSGNETSGWTFNPTVSGTYTLTASQAGLGVAGCTVTATVVVTVNSANAIAAVNNAVVCSGNPVNLSVTSTALGTGPQTSPTGYLPSNATSASDGEILNVTLGTLNNTSTCFTTGGGASLINQYSDFTAVAAPTLIAGTAYPLSVQVGTCGGSFTNYTNVYIDYNRNGVFEASEQAFTQGTGVSGAHLVSGTITIPLTASAGVTRMRVLTIENGSSSSSPTGTYGFGETEDFNVNIISSADATSTYTYAWSSTPSGFTANTATATVNPTVNTTYSVLATSPENCTTTSTVSVTVQNSSAEIGTQPEATQTKCLGATATFTVVATGVNVQYQWRRGTTNLTNGGTISGATSATLTIAGLVAGDAGTDYNVVVSSDCGAPITSDNAALVIVTPLASVSASETTVCSGTPVTITENGGTATSWSWSPGGATTQAITVTPTVTTNYVVTATTQVTGCTATANVTINVNETPSLVTVTPTSATVCSGSTVGANVSGGSFTSTYFADTFDAASSQFTAATVSGTTTTTATLNTAVQSQGTGSVLFNTTGVSSVATYSLNSNVNLTGATAASLTFSHIAAMESPTFSFDFGYVEYSSDGGTTWTTFTSANYTGTAATGVFSGSDVRFSTLSYPDWITAFTGTASLPTNANWKNETFSIPIAALTSQFRLRFRYTTDSSTNYQGWYIDNVKVSAAGVSQYSWTASPSTTLYKDVALSEVYNVGTDFAPTVYAQPTAQTQFTATVANGVCTSSGNATVNVNPLPVITLANSITVCEGTGATITIPEINNTYSWSPSTGITVIDSQSVLANPLVTTTYTVTIINTTTFCQSTRQITVNVNDPGTIVTQPTNKVAAVGFGTTYTVVGTSGISYSYQWQIKTGPTTYTNLANNANYADVNTATLLVNNAGSGTAVDGAIYRCLLTPPAPCSDLATNDVTLTVSTTGIATSPSNVNICLPTPTTAQFSVVTNGDEPYLVEWQVSTDNGVTYNTISLIDVEDTFLYTGPNTTAVPGLTFEHPIDALNPNGTGSEFKVLNVSGISSVSTLRFKAIVNEVLPSAVATLSVTSPATITSDVSTTEAFRCITPASAVATNLSVTTSGAVTSVVWKYDTTPGGSFTNTVANNTPAGATFVASSLGNTYSLAVTTSASTPAGSYYFKAFILGSAACGTTPVQSAMATITVVNPTVAISASSASYCTPGSAVTLTASGASTYSWTSVPSGFTSSLNGVSVTPSGATAYSVEGTDGNGCKNTATVNVGVGTTFTLAASSAASTVCPSTSVALNAVPTLAGPTTYLVNTTPYQFNAVAGTFTPLSGTTVSSGLAATADDTMSATLTPGSGFSFNYGGTNFTNFRVSSNGQLIFGGSGTQSATNNLATTTTTERLGLAPLWDDQLLSTGVNYQLSGTAPNRVLTVEWLNMRWNWQAAGAVISYQVKLYETTNVIEYVYRQEATAYNAGVTGGASIGLMGTASSNFISLQDTSATPGLSTSTSKNDITTKPVTGQIYRFTPVTPVTYTYAWSPTVTGTGASVTASPAVTTPYNVTATSQSGCTASASVTVNVDSAPPTFTTTTAPSQSLCAGATVSFVVTATSATPLTYQWKKDGVNIPSATSATLTGTTTTAASTPSNFTNGTYTVDIIGCTTVTATFTLQVNPLPTATISGSTSVCQNDTAPSVTFTGATGTAPYTFTYKLNGGANQTVTTTSGNSATVAVPTATAGAFAYTLVSVSDANTCSQTQTGGATVRVNATPAASTLAPVPTVCAGNALVFGASAIAPVTGVASYSFAASSGTYTPITGGIALYTSTWDDSRSLLVPLGGTFRFNGVDYNSCNINTNGYVSFGTASTTTNYTPLSSLVANEVGIIAAFARDLRGIVTTGEIRYLSTATEFIVQWTNARRYTTSANAESFNFQIRLDRTTNQARIVYGTFSDAFLGSTANLPQVGLRGATVADYRNVEVLSSGNWSTPSVGGTNTATAYYNEATVAVKPASGLTYTFSPPSAGSYAWSGPNGFSSSLQNPTITNATVAATGTYTLQITNGNGCTATSTVSATVSAQPLWYLDADNDGYYTGIAIPSCTSPGAGYTTTVTGGGDCTDTGILNGVAANLINPGRPEICYNNVDDNCNTLVSEGCAPVVVNMTSTTATLTTFSNAVAANMYSFSPYTNLKYRFIITKIQTGQANEVQEVTLPTRYVTIPGPMRSYTATYTISAAAVINDEILGYLGNTMTVTPPAVAPITLSTGSCGATLTSLNGTISANVGLNATGYIF
ncbi:GEVED domain-containing protein, partial [Flavobacterium sp.]|uniref:Ig-like domain-containing protein n=1 Tax=Flavobacterium sp. TaxID=239 RepID=UPI0037C0ADD4